MSAPDDRKTVFPKEWGWERYEPAVREQAAQCTRRECGRGSLTQNEELHITRLMIAWDDRQVRAGLLPSIEQREKKGQPYRDIFASLENAAWDALKEGRLDKGGLAHWGLEKDPKSPPERQTGGRPRKRDADRER